MKFLVVLSLLSIVSCGKIDIVADANLNSLLSVEPKTITNTEFQDLKRICDSLIVKANYLPSLIGTNYTMGNKFKTCEEPALSDQADSVVTLVSQNGFKFNVGFSSYFFPDVETDVEGVMQYACAKVAAGAGFTLPINLSVTPLQNDVGDEIVNYSTQTISSSDCSATTGETCVKIEKAVVESVTDEGKTSLKGRIHTREWLKIRTSNIQGLEGFYVYRKRLSTAGCIDGAFTVRSATLK